jgi:hypothetical protein
MCKHETDPSHPGSDDCDNFACPLDLGIITGATRSADPTDFPYGIAIAYTGLTAHSPFFLTLMRIRNRTLVLSLILGILVVCGCAAVYWLFSQDLAGSPAPTQIMPGNVEPTEHFSLTSTVPESTVQPAIPERRRLTVEFPPQIRAGDSDLVRLTLEVDDLGNLTPTAQIGGNVVTGEIVEIPNLYETHQVIAESRFDLAGMEVRPPDVVSEALSPGSSVTFQWSIRPADVGVYRGTIWLYLRFVDKQSGEESRKTISAQMVEIESVNLLGLSGEFARTTGIIGSVVGTIIGFPFFEDIIKLFLKRRNKTK